METKKIGDHFSFIEEVRRQVREEAGLIAPRNGSWSQEQQEAFEKVRVLLCQHFDSVFVACSVLNPENSGGISASSSVAHHGVVTSLLKLFANFICKTNTEDALYDLILETKMTEMDKQIENASAVAKDELVKHCMF